MTAKITLKNGKTADVYYGVDEAGNKRLYASNGATLEEWRADSTLIPPWILKEDCINPDDCERLTKELQPQPKPVQCPCCSCEMVTRTAIGSIFSVPDDEIITDRKFQCENCETVVIINNKTYRRYQE
jgi:hypothetical protein